MSSKLAIGAVAALAGLAALTRRGSRNGAPVEVLLTPMGHLKSYLEMREDNAPGWRESVVASIQVGDESHPITLDAVCSLVACDPRFYDEVHDRLQMAADFIEGLDFPLEVYRGVAVRGRDRLNLASPGLNWTPEEQIARRFALDQHWASDGTPGDPGVHSRVLMRSQVHADEVDWPMTFLHYVAYSTLFGDDDGEAEEQVVLRSDPRSRVHVQDLKLRRRLR